MNLENNIEKPPHVYPATVSMKRKFAGQKDL